MSSELSVSTGERSDTRAACASRSRTAFRTGGARPWLTLLGLGVILGACWRTQPEHPAGGSRKPGAIVPGLRLYQADRRPRVGLVQRLGDPAPAVALAMAHKFGSEASVTLATLLESRLHNQGFQSVRSRAHGLGVGVDALATSSEEAARFVLAARRALATPVEAGELPQARIEERLRSLVASRWVGPAGAVVAACSGELGVPGPAGVAQGRSAMSWEMVENWRKGVYCAGLVAYAAVGPPEVLEAVTSALARTDSWPEQPSAEDPWPDEDFVGVDEAPGPPRLTVAVRAADGGRVLAAARTLAEPGSPLGLRLGALESRWKVARVVGTTRLRGACLRLDLEPAESDPAPEPAEVARAAAVTLQETELELASTRDSRFALEQSVLEATDPRDAAQVAAWQVLSGQLAAPSRSRRLVAFRSASARGRAPARELERWLRALGWSSPSRTSLQVLSRVEPGQGQIWLLLASPCGTYTESPRTAGSGALMVRAWVEQATALRGIAVEPWVTPDGIGLLAHTGRLEAGETPEAQAQRLASALGRLLVGAELDGSELGRARALLFAEYGTEPSATFWKALELALPDRPSWLDPRGTWETLNRLTAEVIVARKQAFLAGPLRMAVLANHDQGQVAAAREGVERWLRAISLPEARCAAIEATTPQSGVIVMDTDQPHGAAQLVVPLGGELARHHHEAELTVHLLNRPGGWLERTLGGSNTSRVAQAQLLGGQHGAALLIEIHAPDPELEASVTEVRRMLERLGQGKLETVDAEAARRAHQSREYERRLDPRWRLVDLWYGRADQPFQVAALERFHRRAFAGASLAVVLARSRN